MLFNNLFFSPGLTFFRHGLTFSQKVSGNPAAANILTPKGKNCTTDDINSYKLTETNY